MNTPRKPSRPMPIDPLLRQRLAQLGDRRTPQPLPPPAPDVRPAAAASTARPAGQRPAAPAVGVSADANARLAALAARGNGKPAAGKPGAPGKPVGRKAKPARASKLAALGLSAITTLGLAGMFASQAGSTDSVQLTSGTSGDPLIVAATTSTIAPATPATTADATASTTASTTAETVATTAAPVVPAGVADGTYVGASDSNRWGTVQVQAVYSGGQLVDVQILQYPNGDNKSVSINQRALPTLINEAISIQSADVNTVSGATYTTDSYRISLQSAIDAANAASGITG